MAEESAQPARPVQGPARGRLVPDNLVSDKEITDFLRTLPLFSDELPADFENTPEYAALQALKEEATPEERAEDHKDNGNTAYKLGRARWADAVIFYTQGLEENCPNVKLNATLYCNRAAVLISLGNYGKAVKDCQECLKLEPTNSKAFFRAAKALLELRRYKEALKYCTEGLALPELKDIEKKAFEKLHDEIKPAYDEEEAARRRKEEEEEKKRQAKLRVWNAIKKRGIELSNTRHDSKVEDMKRAEITIDENNTLNWPVCFLYPQYMQSDFIEKFSEKQKFSDHIGHMFPPATDHASWDENKEYEQGNLEIYLLIDDKPVQISVTSTLYSVLTRRGFKVPAVLEFYVVPSSGKFRDEFLAQYK